MARDKKLDRARIALSLSQNPKPNSRFSVVVGAVRQTGKKHKSKPRPPNTLKSALEYVSLKEDGMDTMHLAMAIEAPIEPYFIDGVVLGHLLNYRELTEFCEGVGSTVPTIDRRYTHQFGLVRNIMQAPDQWRPATVQTGFNATELSSVEDVKPDTFQLFGDLRDDIKGMSTIIPKSTWAKKLETALNQYAHDWPEKNFADTLLKLGQLPSAFKVRSDVQSHRSSHYTTHVAPIQGTYTLDHATGQFRVVVQRTIVIAQLNQIKTTKGQRTCLIPLGEEMLIQIQRARDGRFRHAEHGFFIVSKPSSSSLHFLGNNAISFGLSDPTSASSNGYVATARMAGWAIRTLRLASSRNREDLDTAAKLFKPLITQKLKDHYSSELKYESGQASFDDISILKRSFLSKQHTHDLVKSDPPTYSIRQWFASIGLGVVVYSPRSAPDKNYIFVWNRSIAGRKQPSVDPLPINDSSASAVDDDKIPTGPNHVDRAFMRSSLPPELELELELL